MVQLRLNGDSKNLSVDQPNHSEQKIEHHPQFGKKLLSGISTSHALHAGGSWKGDVLVADVEKLQENDASDVYSRRITPKEFLVPEEGDSFMFPCANGLEKMAGKDAEIRPSNRIRQDIEEGEEHRSDFQGATD